MLHHPDRLAIGVCIITKHPICAECSTRFEGVNYSREGLRILWQRRAAQAGQATTSQRAAAVLALACVPISLFMLWWFYRVLGSLLIEVRYLYVGLTTLQINRAGRQF